MTRREGMAAKPILEGSGFAPALNISRIGVVSRDYRKRFANGYSDYSHVLIDVLGLLDDARCDAVLFSLFGIIPRTGYDTRGAFSSLKHIKAVCLEEFAESGDKKDPGRYVVCHKTSSRWEAYCFNQKFGSITRMPRQKIEEFVVDELPSRVLGNCCVLLCGETNGVKYSKNDRKIHDTFGLRDAIPDSVQIILNPIHDRMTRFEMKLKRQFLSEPGRWVTSVWNKGKQDKAGNTRDGNAPAWAVYHAGKQVALAAISNDLGVDVGILDIDEARPGTSRA